MICAVEMQTCVERAKESGFGAHYSIVIIRNPQNSIGNYLWLQQLSGAESTFLQQLLHLGWGSLASGEAWSTNVVTPA